jgi:nucleotide-binding universal stress UspA family protein
MKNRFLTLGVQTKRRAEIIKNALEKQRIKCKIESPDWLTETDEDYVKVQVMIKEFDKAMNVIQSVHKEHGKEVIKIPEEDIQFRKILVPVVFRKYSINACGYAAALAEKLKSEVKLFHSYYNPFTNPEAYTDDMKSKGFFDKYVYSIEEEAEEKLKNLVSQLKKQIEDKRVAGVNIDYILTGGAIFNQLEKQEREYKPDLIVLGTKGANKKHNDLLGKFTVKVMENTEIPVLAIPEDTTYTSIDNLNILYATDFDSTDYIALSQLMNMAAPFNPSVHCIHVEKNPDSAKIQPRLNKLKSFFDTFYENKNVECKIIDDSNILASLQSYIKEKNIHMVAFTRHKHNVLLKHFKSTMEKRIIFHTNLPVLIFPV